MRDRTFDGFVTAAGKLTLDFPAQFKRWVAATFPGCEVVLTVEDKALAKTRAQECGYHAMLKPWVAEGHRISDLKYFMLREVFGEMEVMNPVTCEVTKTLREPHTSTLTKAQYSELIERTLEIAAGCGVLLEAPSDYKERKRREAKKARVA